MYILLLIFLSISVDSFPRSEGIEAKTAYLEADGGHTLMEAFSAEPVLVHRAQLARCSVLCPCLCSEGPRLSLL